MRLPLNGNPRVTNTHGAAGWGHFGKHIGYDYGVGIGTLVYAPERMVIIAKYQGGSGGRMIEARSADGKRQHRFLHLSNNWDVNVGDVIDEGQYFAKSGNTGKVTGPHLHHDVRVAHTVWSDSYANYYDWHALVEQSQRPSFQLPPVGSAIQLLPQDVRTTFKAGTAQIAGLINVTDHTFFYTVRGHDPVYKNRIIINSAMGGGNGVSLALYYLNGTLIPNWKKV